MINHYHTNISENGFPYIDVSAPAQLVGVFLSDEARAIPVCDYIMNLISDVRQQKRPGLCLSLNLFVLEANARTVTVREDDSVFGDDVRSCTVSMDEFVALLTKWREFVFKQSESSSI